MAQKLKQHHLEQRFLWMMYPLLFLANQTTKEHFLILKNLMMMYMDH